MHNKKATIAIAAVFAILVVAVVAMNAVGGGLQQVCHRGIMQYRLVALTSMSDVKLAHTDAKPVADQVAAAAAQSCASIETGVPGANPASNLDLSMTTLTPTQTTAPDRAPEIAQLTRQADRFLQRNFVAPTLATSGTDGSPIFGTLAAIAHYRQAEHLGPGCTVFITDGLALERWPGGLVNFTESPPANMQHRLAAIVPYLRGLAGENVVILGFGAASPYHSASLTRAYSYIREVLSEAHAHFDAVRSLRLPARCGA